MAEKPKNEKQLRKERMNETRLFGVLNGGSRKPRTNSVPTTTAQTTTLLQLPGQPYTQFTDLVPDPERMMRYSHELYHLVQFMLVSGCRVSEVLRVRPCDIMTSGHVVIKASKGSLDRLVHTGISMPWFVDCKKKGRDPFIDWDRFRVYREFKKWGISVKLAGHQNASVTHSLRQITSRQFQAQGVDDDLRSRHLGHKSSKTIRHYSDGKKR